MSTQEPAFSEVVKKGSRGAVYTPVSPAVSQFACTNRQRISGTARWLPW